MKNPKVVHADSWACRIRRSTARYITPAEAGLRLPRGSVVFTTLVILSAGSTSSSVRDSALRYSVEQSFATVGSLGVHRVLKNVLTEKEANRTIDSLVR